MTNGVKHAGRKSNNLFKGTGRPSINIIILMVALLAALLACHMPQRETGDETPTALPDASKVTTSAVRSTSTPKITAGPTPTPFTCDEPEMVLLQIDPASTSGEEVPQPPPGQTYQTIAFLELPFPYDGGNENFGGTHGDFRRASQRSGAGGRINSYFDHLYPLYPAESRGREPAEPPYGDHVLTYEGTLFDDSTTWYSGHPGYDYSTFVPRKATTPLFAAANGVIYDVGEHEASGALYVKIKHTIPGVGDFVTIYWHLEPDGYFEGIKGHKGDPIAAGTRVGTMGNTGWSTGHHLHFEVRFDGNRDGHFSLDEAVDPYGFIPSSAYPADPWAINAEFTDGRDQAYSHVGRVSPYLWIHPLGGAAAIPESGGGEISFAEDGIGEGENTVLCAPAGSLPPGGVVYWYWSSDPPPSEDAAGANGNFVLSIFDRLGNPIPSFDFSIPFQITFRADDIIDLDPSTLRIYWREFGSLEWVALPTQINLDRGVAIAATDRPGQAALLGRPIRDFLPPTTQIEVTGPVTEDGVFYGEVTVSLSSSDPNGIEKIEYSLDSGTTWQVYTEPFTLEPSGQPDPLPDEPVHDLGSGAGRYLVLVSSTDGVKNMEEPPKFRGITIDPCGGPGLTATANKNANCRAGPALGYGVVDYLLANQTAVVEGRSTDSFWWYIQRVDAPGHCWVANDVVELEGEPACVGVVVVPPAPPSDLAIVDRKCNAKVHQITLQWSDNANDEAGYRVYRSGELIATLPVNSTSFTDNAPFGGPFTYAVGSYNNVGNSTQMQVTESEACALSTASISGVVWDDFDGDGFQGSGETELGGYDVWLGQGACSSSGYRTTTSAGNGYYSFTNLPAGTYCLTVDIPLGSCGWNATTTHPRTITLDPGENVGGVHFGFRYLVC